MNVLIPQQIENIVYQDKFDSLDERVKRLEKGGNLTDVSGIERRLQILEEKCKNIIIDEDTLTVPNESMTIEERLQILERKCANIKI